MKATAPLTPSSPCSGPDSESSPCPLTPVAYVPLSLRVYSQTTLGRGSGVSLASSKASFHTAREHDAFSVSKENIDQGQHDLAQSPMHRAPPSAAACDAPTPEHGLSVTSSMMPDDAEGKLFSTQPWNHDTGPPSSDTSDASPARQSPLAVGADSPERERVEEHTCLCEGNLLIDEAEVEPVVNEATSAPVDAPECTENMGRDGVRGAVCLDEAETHLPTDEEDMQSEWEVFGVCACNA